MKKFITYISRQIGNGLKSGIYTAVGNARLQTDFPVHFPVVTMMAGYITEGETVEVLFLYNEDSPAYADNLRALKEDIAELKTRCDFNYSLTEIQLSSEETSKEHLRAFSSLLEAIKDDDELYVCCTYGSKPTPIVEMMAVNFAYKIRDNVAVECIVYGFMNHKTDEARVYDITPLFFMTQIMDRLAEQGIREPESVIRRMLQIDNDDEGGNADG